MHYTIDIYKEHTMDTILQSKTLINNTNKTKLLTNNYKQGIKISHELVLIN